MDVGTPAEQSPGTRDCLAGVARRAVIHRAAVRILAFGMPIVAVAAALLIPIAIGPQPCPAILCWMYEPRLYEVPVRLAWAWPLWGLEGCISGSWDGVLKPSPEA